MYHLGKFSVFPYNKYHPLYAKHPIISGEGVILSDESGKKYTDLSSSTLNMALGHRHPDVVQAVQEQLNKVWFVATYFQNPAFLELGKLLVKHAQMKSQQ